MEVPGPRLTQAAVNQAEARIGISHPVIAVLDQYSPQLIQLQQGYSSLTDVEEQQRFVRENYGFLAVAIVEAGPFTLRAEDIVAIWSRAIEVFRLPPIKDQRYALAGMVTAAYCIQGAASPEWKSYPRRVVEGRGIPEWIMTDSQVLVPVRRRLEEVGKSLHEIDFYLYGTEEPAQELAANLYLKGREGDKEAETAYNTLNDYFKAHRTPVLEEIGENFRNGLMSIYRDLKNWT